ncbi:MAG: cobyrinate a,c-diamide synthase [Thiohalocapsa sp.]
MSKTRLDPVRSPRHCPALFLTACSSGQGKTTLVAALARHHRRLGRRVRVFKTGPDFLDPMILKRASGAEVGPLDLWMVGESDCRRKLHAAAGEADLILIEGAMGLFDGSPSGADLAETFAVPLAALIDARGMGQTFGALALGLAHYRPALRFAGVTANQVASARHAEMIQAGMPDSLPFLGSFPRLTEAALPSRHLGLVQAEEIADLEQRIEAAADQIAKTALAELPEAITFAPPPEQSTPPQVLAGKRIAVARDAAFSFIYADNLRLLEAMGAELRFFSPLADTAVTADAIYLPGGYPELHLQALAANAGMQRALTDHVAAHRPLYAECGGMLYLLDRLTDKSGARAEMAGLLPGQGRIQPGLAGLGMQSLDIGRGSLRGHSFHHSTMETPLGPIAFGTRQHDNRLGEPFYRRGSLRASYLHLYFPSVPEAAAALFLDDRSA